VKLFVRAPAVAVALIALTSGCAGSPSATAVSGVDAQSIGRLTAPAPLATGLPAVRAGAATPVESRIVRGDQQVLVTQSFANTSTTGWIAYKSCLTAGTSPKKRQGSIPKCGSQASQDPPGGGALELTGPVTYRSGLAGYDTALPTANGLEITFDYYSFDGSGADGSLVYLADGSQSPPQEPGSNKNCGGCLGYVPAFRRPGLPGAYLGVGLDEYGDFGRFLPGGPGQIGQTIYLGGAQSIGYEYLGGVVNGSGRQVSLPFDLDSPQEQTRPTTPLTFYISIAADGLVEVAIDIHDGNGPVTYVSKNIVGVAGQPAVPATVYVGFIGSCGGDDDRHQVNNLEIETLQ
jgi:hypothetical protein